MGAPKSCRHSNPIWPACNRGGAGHQEAGPGQGQKNSNLLAEQSVEDNKTTRGVGSHHQGQPTVSFLPLSNLQLMKNRGASKLRHYVLAARGWLAGTSSSVNEKTNIGVGATRPQRFTSQRARMKRTSGRMVRSSNSRVRPR